MIAHRLHAGHELGEQVRFAARVRLCGMAISPLPKCAGFDMLMPLRQDAHNGGEPVEGKTTSLKFGWKGSVVDKSDWLD